MRDRTIYLPSGTPVAVPESSVPLRYDYHWSIVGNNEDCLGTFDELDELVAKWVRPSTHMQAISKAEREYRAHNGEKGLLP
jgi:hypothetical protein